MNKLLPLLLLALFGCQQQPDKREVCARYSAGVLSGGKALTLLDLWNDGETTLRSDQIRWRMDDFCEFYK